MKRLSLAAASGLLILGAACNRGGEGNANDRGASKGAPLLRREDEIDNDKLIAWLKAKVDSDPATAGRGRLANIYLTRGQMRGRLDDFESCVKYAGQEIELTHTSGAYKLQARCLISLHRFSDALGDLDAAAKHADSNPEEALGLRGDISWALGRYDEALENYRNARRPQDAAGMVRLANLDAELGDAKSADALFAAAEKIVAGKDKNYEAWLQVQRALRHLDAGQISEARQRVDSALALDPKNVLARQYSAQLLVLEGHAHEAEDAYRELILTTDNPEHISALAVLLRKRGDESGAKTLVEQARARYDADLAAFPAALWQHDGQFLLEQGLDPAAAVAVLAKNADARPSAASWIPLAWAQVANGDSKAARATIDRALATPAKTAKLYWTAAHVADEQRDPRRAESMREKALALNPRIAEMITWR